MFFEPFAAGQDACLRLPKPHKPIVKAPLPPGRIFAFLFPTSRGLIGASCPLGKGGAPGPISCWPIEVDAAVG